MRHWTDQQRKDVLYSLLSPDEMIRRVKQYGDYKPIQWMFRTGQTDRITSMMNDYPEFSKIVADALSGQFVGDVGQLKQVGLNNEERNDFLLKRIHYWINQGLPCKPNEKKTDACSRAVDDLIEFIANRNHFLSWSVIAPDTVYKTVWKKRESFDWYIEKLEAGIYDMDKSDGWLRFIASQDYKKGE